MKEAVKSSTSWLTTANLIWLAIYLLTMSGVVGGLVYARQTALAKFASPEAQADWEKFRSEMERLSKDETAPVARRPPEAKQPPTMLLLRDYFISCTAISLLLSSALFVTVMIMVRGVVGGERFTPHEDG